MRLLLDTNVVLWLHRDPFDRLLVAQARSEEATLVTADTRIREYDIPTLWGQASG